METYTYRGKLIWVSNGEVDCLGFVNENTNRADILVREIYDDVGYSYRGQKQLTVRYYTSDTPIPESPAESFMAVLMGGAEVNYSMAYSEITGYLWTDQDLIIGGHDLRDELETFIGKYLHLEIDVHQ